MNSSVNSRKRFDPDSEEDKFVPGFDQNARPHSYVLGGPVFGISFRYCFVTITSSIAPHGEPHKAFKVLDIANISRVAVRSRVRYVVTKADQSLTYQVPARLKSMFEESLSIVGAQWELPGACSA